MRGKEKCKALKEIRRQIAEKNEIPYVVSQCTHQGDCRGTCPRCEAELRYLERELAIRQGLGKAVAVVGISTSVCAGLTACSPVAMIRNAPGGGVEDIAGDISVIQPEDIDGFLEAPPELEQIEGKVVSEEGENQAEIQSTASEESTESQEIDDYAAGRILPSEETEETEETEELLMGEIPPPEYPTEEIIFEVAGDIALPPDQEYSAESCPPMEEQIP